MHDRDSAHIGIELGRQRHHLRHRARARTEQCRQRIPTVRQAQVTGGGGHDADRRDDEQRDAQRPARNPLERVWCDHRPQQNTDEHKAQAREGQRYLHGTARERGDRDRQHRARDQSAWKAEEMESYSAHRSNEQRPHNLHELTQWGSRRRHRFVPTLGSPGKARPAVRF